MDTTCRVAGLLWPFFYGLYQPGNVMPLDIHNRSEILKKIQNGGYQICQEVSKEIHDQYKREDRRHRYLKETQKDVSILSYHALDGDSISGENLIAGEQVDVEGAAIRNVMLEKLREGLSTLTDDELYIIEYLIYQEKTERELAKKLHISQIAVHKRKVKILEKLRKFLEK